VLGCFYGEHVVFGFGFGLVFDFDFFSDLGEEGAGEGLASSTQPH
jgi:hypothetical protein